MSTLDRIDRQSGAAESEREGDAAGAGGEAELLRMRAMHRRWIQRKASGANGGGAAAIPQSGGSPLDGSIRARMEGALGADLSGARLHTGGESATAAESMGARAFTVGGDVHFGRGEFAPGTKEGDRLLAHELAHVVQGQKSGVQRKADANAGDEHGAGEHGDHEAGGHEVSEPGDAAEQEADAAGDHAAEQLHGGKGKKGGKDKKGDKAGADGKEDAHAKEGDGKEAEAGGAEAQGGTERPKLGESAPAVGRKIFRAKAPSGSKGAPPKGAAPAKGAPDPNALSPQDQQKVAKLKTTLESAQIAPGLNVQLKAMEPDITKFSTGPQAKDPAVMALKAAYDAKQLALEQAFDTALNGAAQALAAINVEQPGAHAQFQSTWKAPDVDKWAGLAMFSFKDRPSAVAFKAAKEKTDKAIKDKHREVMSKASQEIKAVHNDPDPTKPNDNPLAKAESIFEGTKTWMGALGAEMAYETTLKEAYVSKREQINAATATREAKKAAEQAAAAEKQKQHAQGGDKDKDKDKDKGSAQSAAPAPGAAAAAPATGAKPNEEKKTPPPPAQAQAPAPAQAPPAQQNAAQKHPSGAQGHDPPPQQHVESKPPPMPAPAQGGPQAQGPDEKDHHQHDPSAQAAPAPASANAAAPAPAAQAPAQGAAPPAGGAAKLTPEQENKLEQLEVMLEIASTEAAQSTNAYNVGATAVLNLATAINPGFLVAGLAKSGGMLAAKFKHEFETKVATKMLKQLPPDQIDALLAEWTKDTPTFETACIDIKLNYGKVLSAKSKVGAGLSGAKQLGKDDWKEIAVEGGEVAEHVAKELVHELPHVVESIGHALPFLGIGASIWSVIANIRKVRHLRAELQQLQEQKFGPGGQPAAPASTPKP